MSGIPVCKLLHSGVQYMLLTHQAGVTCEMLAVIAGLALGGYAHRSHLLHLRSRRHAGQPASWTRLAPGLLFMCGGWATVSSLGLISRCRG
jgi:hypothetical protein